MWRQKAQIDDRASAAGSGIRGWLAGLLSLALIAGTLLLAPGLTAPAQAAQILECAGADYNGLNRHNDPEDVYRGYYKQGSRPLTRVAPSASRHDVDWDVNPYSDLSWRRWFHSLKWLGELVLRAGGRSIDGVKPTAAQRDRALTHAMAVTYDYIRDNPARGAAALVANSSRHRLHFLACLAEADQRINGSVRPWLSSAIADTFVLVRENYAGNWNKGIDDAYAASLAGCWVDDDAMVEWGRQRLRELAQSTIDHQGVTTEQSLGYGDYAYRRWLTVSERLTSCGVSVPSELDARLQLAPAFFAHGTDPSGEYVQLGDTERRSPNVGITDPGVVFARTGGRSGTPLAETKRIYDAYAFGRTSWRSDAAHYSVRYGPGRNYHGHIDHTAITYFARGHQVLVDPGHVGFSDQRLRRKMWRPEMHNTVSASARWLSGPQGSRPAFLRDHSLSAERDVFRLADSRYKKVKRYRNVHFDHDLGAVVVYDKVRTRNGRKANFSQNWHLPPGWTLDRVGRGYARFVNGQERIWFRIVPLSFQEGKKTRRGQLFGMGGTTVSQTLRAPDTDTRLSGPTVRFRDRAKSTAFLTVIVASSRSTRTKAALVPGSRPGTVTVQVGGNTKTFDVG